MLSRYIASLLFGAGAGGAATFYLFRRKREEGVTEPAALHHALKYGMPSSEGLRFFQNFVLSFDSRTRNPRWVLEHITRAQTRGDGNRKNVEFYEDKELDQRFRSRLSDFRESGYDRGHMAPAANHKETADTMLETFVLSNISPQVGRGFNRDYWARFERFINLLTRTCDDVYVVTGPLFLPSKTPLGYMMQHPMIGQPPRMVAVPTHFFKVVLAERTAVNSVDSDTSTEAVMGAFVLPNAPLQADLPLTAFSVPLEALEEAAGLQFFPGFLNADRRAALDRAALAYQKWGRQQMKLKGVPGASLDFFQPPLPPPLALKEPVEVASSAVVERLDAASSTPTDAPSAVKIIVEHEPGVQSRGVCGNSSTAAASDSSKSMSAADAGGASSDANSSQTGKKLRKSRSKKSVPMSADLGVVHVCDVVECKLPAEDWYLASKNRRT
ncbi:probable endonuclease G, mitochondrial [Coccomyxa sp. Obi]|nr:probable endonuclease G, mitochondrial [Coccomyxa sp. Obi]